MYKLDLALNNLQVLILCETKTIQIRMAMVMKSALLATACESLSQNVNIFFFIIYHIYQPPLGKDMTQGQLLSGV